MQIYHWRLHKTYSGRAAESQAHIKIHQLPEKRANKRTQQLKVIGAWQLVTSNVLFPYFGS